MANLTAMDLESRTLAKPAEERKTTMRQSNERRKSPLYDHDKKADEAAEKSKAAEAEAAAKKAEAEKAKTKE